MRPARRYYIDGLRVLAVLLLVPFHAARVFDFEPFHIQNAQLSGALDSFVGFVSIWHMKLFFMLAGAGAFYALSFRSGVEFARERFLRLFVPLVAGILIVIPPQVYVERISSFVATRISPVNFSGSYAEFYPEFFRCCYPQANLSYHHLWFLFYLFVFSLVGIPLFRKLLSPPGEALRGRIAGFLGRGRNIFIPVVPLLVIELALRPFFPYWQDFIHDWANNAHFMTVFVYGFLAVSDELLGEATDRNWPAALAAATVLSLALLMISLYVQKSGPMRMFNLALYVCAEWCWLVALWGAGRKTLNGRNRFISYFSGIALPFYIVHQTVIVVLAYFVVRLDAGVAGKYALIVAGAGCASVLLCEAVKRTPFTRILFGMPWRGRFAQRPS